ncbi:MAG: NYN domain-containing protein [Acidobacteriota bacterium]
MPTEPATKRCFAFVDGQNLFNAAKEAFGYHFPNYDVLAVTRAVCAREGWELKQTWFYTGMPVYEKDKPRHGFWSRKLAVMGRQGVKTFHRNVTYRNKEIRLGDGTTLQREVAEEKGIDVRIAIDLMRFAFERRYDVALIFSQDQDLSEAAKEVRRISVEQKRWIKIASAFPVSATSRNRRGINETVIA